MLPRPPFAPPDVPPPAHSPHARHILFCHPAYDDSSNVLLKLFAPDAAPSPGLHATYALVACGIIAGNRWDGWLSETRDPTTPPAIKMDSMTILDKPLYYFHLPQTSDGSGSSPYPIVPNFGEWEFPHHHLPPPWTLAAPAEAADQTGSVSALTNMLKIRDTSCRVSGCVEGTQVAHICPQSEADWFSRNGMSRYNSTNSSNGHDPSNALLLRADLHILFDTPKFVFVPKSSSTPQSPSPQVVLHLVEPSLELESLYHNRSLQEPCRVRFEMLLARFAWTMFPLLDAFLMNGVPRRLKLRTATVGVGGNATAEDVGPLAFTAPEICAQYGTKAQRSRNQSPKKRGRQEQEQEHGHESEGPRPRKRWQGAGSIDIQLSPSTSPASDPKTPAVPDVGDTSATLRDTWLRQERARSDPDKTWEQEEMWAAEVYDGDITLGEKEARRWLEFNGEDFIDDG